MTSTSPPSPPPESDSDRRTHTTHTINLPYRDARNGASRPQNPQQRQPCAQHDDSHSHSHNHQHQHHSREPPKITPIPRISSTTHNSLAETTPPPSSPTSYPSPTNAPPASSSSPSAAPAAPPPADERPSTPASSSTGSDHEASLAEGLEGKYVDEFGNILDWDGTVLGRVEGDLPSMIGRPVAESGDILDANGDVVGHVSENYPQQQRQQEEARAKIPPLHELEGGMRVDAAGNIYNSKGDVVGRLNEPPPQSQQDQPRPRPGEDSRNPCSCREPDRAAAAAPNPSEIYLDVKSTYDGIQLIIKIPTVFNRDLIDQDR